MLRARKRRFSQKYKVKTCLTDTQGKQYQHLKVFLSGEEAQDAALFRDDRESFRVYVSENSGHRLF